MTNDTSNLPCGVGNGDIDKYWEENEMDTNDIISSLELGIRSLEGRLDRERDRAIKHLEDAEFELAITAAMNAQAASYAISELEFQLEEIEASRG